MAVEVDTPKIVPGRACGTCTLCCKVLVIHELSKPSGTWCPKCKVGKGCSIYGEHPSECRTFFCGYLIGPQLAEHWRPTRAKMVLSFDDRHITVHVDPGTPSAWRNEPCYSDLKRWSSEVAALRGNVYVAIGRRVIVMLPQGGETDLGTVGEDERILTRELPGFAGKRLDVIKVKHDDPRLGGKGSGGAFLPARW
ncbi:MAG: hypothetical protein U1E60_04360 [Reyranellaceae bacterium]